MLLVATITLLFIIVRHVATAMLYVTGYVTRLYMPQALCCCRQHMLPFFHAADDAAAMLLCFRFRRLSIY